MRVIACACSRAIAYLVRYLSKLFYSKENRNESKQDYRIEKM
jgi:hypothetical protein